MTGLSCRENLKNENENLPSHDAATIVRNDAVQEIPKLKQQSGKDMVIWGSISLAQSLIDKGLIDEYRLVVCPVVLGSGKPLFRDNGRALDLKLSNARTLDRGAVLLNYVPRRAGSGSSRS